MHAKRRRAVADAVTALLSCGRVVAASMGRAIARRTSDKHGIKRIDRLLGNRRLHAELPKTYAALAALTVGNTARPVLLVDWTELGRDKCALSAVLALQGRGVPLYTESHPIRLQSARKVQRRFLARLADILPPDCTPVLVTDAGFKVPWMQAVRARGWDFVTRVRGHVQVRTDQDSPWFRAQECTAQRPPVQDFPHAQLNKSEPVPTRLVIADRRSKRARRTPRIAGRRIRVRRAVRAASEPWLLATSLDSCPAEHVASIYALRMQIEESLRDLKSHLLGWAFEDARCTSCQRIDVQLLLVSFATIASLLAGIATELARQQRLFHANTERRRRVLSLVTLGRRVLSVARAPWLTADLMLGALWWMTQHVPQLLAATSATK
jgi:hypothetical protein